MPEKQYFEGIDIVSGGTVISSADVTDTEARASLDDLEGYVESIAPVALNVTENGTYTAPTGVFGYSPVTVAVSKDFYPKAHATLDDASRVEGDDMRVYPMGGTDYYPYVYLGVKPYNTQEEYEPVGKYFAGRSTEYTASIFLDLIDVETGESATGYPQRVAPTQANFSIVSGGYCRVKAWSVISNASQVSITIERFNPTYTKPIENTYTSVSVTPLDALQSYLNTSYYIDGGAGESVLLQSLTATANGTYTAPARTAYNEVTVDVQEQPWQPLEDGYSNFWFELTDDTLSPWLNFSAKTEDAVIDWGDGSGEVALDTLTPTHTYAKAGKYVVKVKGVTGIAKQGFDYTTDYLTVLIYAELNNEIVSIPSNCFTMCNSLRGFDGRYLETIGSQAFQFCGALRTIRLDSVTIVSATGAFSYNPGLREITFSAIQVLGNSAFWYATRIAKITLPSTLTTIGNACFQYCYFLSEVHIQATTPPSLGTNAFANLPSNWLCYVPVGTLSAYQSAWSTYADHILEEGQTPNRAMLSRLAKAADIDTDEDMR